MPNKFWPRVVWCGVVWWGGWWWLVGGGGTGDGMGVRGEGRVVVVVQAEFRTESLSD